MNPVDCWSYFDRCDHFTSGLIWPFFFSTSWVVEAFPAVCHWDYISLLQYGLELLPHLNFLLLRNTAVCWVGKGEFVKHGIRNNGTTEWLFIIVWNVFLHFVCILFCNESAVIDNRNSQCRVLLSMEQSFISLGTTDKFFSQHALNEEPCLNNPKPCNYHILIVPSFYSVTKEPKHSLQHGVH